MSLKDAINGVTSAHVKKALAKIDRHGIPKNRRSTRWCLKDGSRLYPPKYVLSLAVQEATGQPLHHAAHSGGEKTNRILKGLGFEIVSCLGGGNALEN